MIDSRTILATLLAATFLVGGCNKKDDQQFATFSTQVSATDHIDRAISLVSTDTQFERAEFEEKVVTGLKRWVQIQENEPTQVEWQIDPLLEQLPDAYQEMDLFKKIKDNTFFATDAEFLKQSSWLKSIASRVAGHNVVGVWPPLEPIDYSNLDPDKDALADALKANQTGINDQQAGELAKTMRLFDWTIRAIQLDPTPPVLSPKEIEQQKLTLTKEGLPLAEMGIAGPGYSNYIWQTLLYGRGDFLERARVFIALGNQLGIDIVMLATKNEDKVDPWVAGALIGDDIYLFDTVLGLPIFDKDGKLVTLKQVKSDASIPQNLDLTVDETLEKDRAYRVQSSDLNDVIALIDAGPEAISQRMAKLEQSLSGDKRMVLTRSPSSVKNRLVKNTDISSVQLWDVPFKVHQYRAVLREAVKAASYEARLQARLVDFMVNESHIESFVLFRTAKTRYLQGLFDTDRSSTQMSSIRLLADMRYTDDEIRDVAANDWLLSALKIRRAGQSPIDFERRIRGTQSSMRKIRVDAAYFLGVANFEADSPSTAINWLNRVSDFDEIGRWENGVRYMKSRSQEALGNLDVATDLLNQSKYAKADVLVAELPGRRIDGNRPAGVELFAQGKIVVSVVVGQDGRIIKQEILPDESTTDDPALIDYTSEYIDQSFFDENQSAPSEQTGKLVFVFTLPPQRHGDLLRARMLNDFENTSSQ